MLPLGIAYFILTAVLLAVALGLLGLPVVMLFGHDWLQGLVVDRTILLDWGSGPHVPGWGEVLAMFLLGAGLLFATLHLVRGIGRLHGAMAKHLLVRGTARSAS
jgi:hypothetical protein